MLLQHKIILLTAVFFTCVSCTQQISQVVVESIFDKDIYIGMKVSDADFKILCDRTENQDELKFCIVENEEIFAFFSLKNSKINQIFVQDASADYEYLKLEKAVNKLNELGQVTRLKGLGNYYQLNDGYAEFLYFHSKHLNTRPRAELFMTTSSKTEYRHIDASKKQVDSKNSQQTGRASLGLFILGKNLSGRNPAGYVCTTIKLLDLTECMHENIYFYREELLNNPIENEHIKKEPNNPPDIIWLDKTEIIGMEYKYSDSFTIDKLINYYGGKHNFTKLLYGNKLDTMPSYGGGDFYTVYNDQDLIEIQAIYLMDLLSIKMHSYDSHYTMSFLSNQKELAIN